MINTVETVYLGGGCFWCLEAFFNRIKGVRSVVSGYAGGKMWPESGSPTYEEVSSGETGHAEVVKIEFDPAVISFEMILNIFFVMHDPTTLNRQGSDIGTQYRSVILYTNQTQKEVAEKIIKELEQGKLYENPFVTEIKLLEKFYPAEDYHQKYFEKNPNAGYCQAVISPKIGKLREKFNHLLKN